MNVLKNHRPFNAASPTLVVVVVVVVVGGGASPPRDYTFLKMDHNGKGVGG